MRTLHHATLAIVAACGAPAAAPLAPAAPPATSTVVAPPPEPLEFVQRDDAGKETVVKAYRGYHAPDLVYDQWEDIGVFAYARRTTKLMAGGVAIGWLDPGARVGVIFTDAEVTEVILFAWHDMHGPVHATVAAADLGATAIPLVSSEPNHPRRTVMSGQALHRSDGSELGYTFCGDLELVEQPALGAGLGTSTALHVIQREDGVVIEGVLAKRSYWQEDKACPGRVVLEDYDGRRIRYHDRYRRIAALPDDLVAAKSITGPTLAQLIAKRATIWWMTTDDGRASCEGWQLVPPAKGADTATITHREKLDDGGYVITDFGVMFGTEPTTRVALLGPNSQQYDRNGKPGGGIGFGCGSDYQVIESEPGMLLMLHRPPSLANKILGYEPLDAERWYTDKARCERDLEAKRNKVALGVAPHTGC